MSAIEKIEKQQIALKKGSAPWCVGEQLKEICADPVCEKLVDTDLDNPAMGLVECEKKIKAYADKHKEGNFAFVSPLKAEEIIRGFYGLPKHGEKPAQKKADIIDLGDFL